MPAGVSCERDYRAVRVRGPLPLNLVGIVAAIADPLAEAGMSIFAISTYDTDYVLVKAWELEQALQVLGRAGSPDHALGGCRTGQRQASMTEWI